MNEKVLINELTFYYGDNSAVKNVSISVKENSVLALIGPSGCGKSTLLRCVNRMNDIIPGTRVEGDILIDGSSIYADKYNVSDLRRRVAYSGPQSRQ